MKPGLPCFWLLVALTIACKPSTDPFGQSSDNNDAGGDSPAGSGGAGASNTGTGGDGGGCIEDEQQCENGVHQICDGGGFVDDPCATGETCDASGACVACVCEPGTEGACVDETTINVCQDDCLGYAPTACPQMSECDRGECVPYDCAPGSIHCIDTSTYEICTADGLGYEPGGTCLEKEICGGAGCVSYCDVSDAHLSSVGCSFFALNMDNFNEDNPDAVVVGNTHPTLTAVVSLHGSYGGVESLIEGGVQIPPASQHTFMLPNQPIDVIENGSMLRTGGAFRVSSDLPVVAYQHSPLMPQATNDASCLLPEPTLSMHYIVASYTDALNGYPSYFNVIAAENGTSVTFTVPVATSGGAGVPGLSAGQSATVTMNRYDTLQVVAIGSDITGTEIVATAPVAVFGAVECAQVPAGTSYCDHIEEQSIPTVAWGLNYIGAHAPMRSGTEHFYWRVLAQEDGTTVHTDPVQTGFPVTLSKGEFYEFWTQESFVFSGNKAFGAFQYVSGQNSFGAGTGDPAMMTAVPVEQFLASYVILTPVGYTQDYVQILRTSNADVLVDGAIVPAASYYSVGAYSVADYPVTAGSHVITSTTPFGIMGVGYTEVTSYAYPGGLALAHL